MSGSNWLCGRPVPDDLATGAVAEDVDVGAGDRHHHAPGHVRLGHPQLGVDAGHDDVEPLEQVVVLVERPVLDDVDLHAGEDPERGQLLVERLDLVELLEQPLAVEAVGDGEPRRVVGDDEVLVPEALRGAGHHLGGGAAVAPGGVAVAVAPQRGAQLGALADVDGRLVLELGEVLVDAAVERQHDHLARGRADAGQVEQRAVGVVLGDGVVAQLPDEVAGLAVGGHPAAFGQGAVEQVHDAIEGVGRTHRATLPTAPLRSSPRRPPYPAAMERFGFVGSAQRRQVVAVQRAGRRRGPRRALRVRHHRPERRHGPGARPAPRRPGRDEQEQERGAGHRAVRRHRRAGRRGQQGRGARQQVPQPHPRGRRHRVRAPGLRGRRRARPLRPARAPRGRGAGAHLRRPRDGREPDREAPQGGQGRQVAGRRGGGPRQGQGRPRDGHAALPLRPHRRTSASCSRAGSCSPTAR